MDSTPSQDVANLLATSTSRRQALQALTATAVGVPLALNGIATTFASPQEPHSSHQVQTARGKAEDIVALAQEAMKQYDPLATAAIMTSTIEAVRKSAIAVGEGTLVSPASHQEQIAPVSLLNPKVYYAMGVFIDNSWVLQNPLFSGYNAVMAYLPAKKIAIAVTTTLGEKSSPSTNYSTLLFQRIGTYLAPDQPPS
jgi:hypothetical protein